MEVTTEEEINSQFVIHQYTIATLLSPITCSTEKQANPQRHVTKAVSSIQEPSAVSKNGYKCLSNPK